MFAQPQPTNLSEFVRVNTCIVFAKLGCQPRFTTCDVCQVLKFELANRALALERRLGVLKQYRDHLAEQYRDRAAVWTLQAASADPQSGVVCLVIDRMDQGKFCIPRDPALECAASLAKANRPRMAVHACWAMGYCLKVAVAHETVMKDSSFILELLSQTLQQAGQG